MKKIIRKLLLGKYADNQSYIEYLRENGAKIGKNVVFLSPNKRPIDEKRIKFCDIGNNVIICEGVKIIIHDFSWSVLSKSHDEILPSWGGKVKIGHNSFIGVNTVILKDCEIGDNVIIGAGSVVSSSLPSNTVCAGNPCRVISSLDSFYEKRKNELIENAVLLFKELEQEQKRIPPVEDMGWFSYLFLDLEERKEVFQKLRMIGTSFDKIYNVYLNIKKEFNNYEEFVEYAKSSAFSYKYKKIKK